jgi:hypothetical protein
MQIFEEIKDAPGQGMSHVVNAKAQIVLKDVAKARQSLQRGYEMFELGSDVCGTFFGTVPIGSVHARQSLRAPGLPLTLSPMPLPLTMLDSARTCAC